MIDNLAADTRVFTSNAFLVTGDRTVLVDPGQEFVDVSIDDGETVRVGDDDYQALHTPGHRDDHLCLYAADPGILFAGDLVFANGSFGRTDLPEGDRATLVESIESVLEAVDEDLAEMHTGHGPSVTTDPYDDIRIAFRAAGGQ